jgi:hypothetical protein
MHEDLSRYHAPVTDLFPRRATVGNVFRDGVRSDSDSPTLEGVPAIPKGQPMGGRFLPLLFGEKWAAGS